MGSRTDDDPIPEGHRIPRGNVEIDHFFSPGKIIRSQRIGRKQTITPRVPPGRITRIVRMVTNHHRNFLSIDISEQIHPAGTTSPYTDSAVAFTTEVIASDRCIVHFFYFFRLSTGAV